MKHKTYIKNIDTENGVYISAKASKESKKKIKEFVKNELKINTDYDDYHITLIYSKKPFSGEIKLLLPNGKLETFVKKYTKFDNQQDGDSSLVFVLDSKDAQKLHKILMEKYDFKYDYDEYIPHLTLTYKAFDITEKEYNNFPIPQFKIEFDDIIIQEIDNEWIKKKEK